MSVQRHEVWLCSGCDHCQPLNRTAGRPHDLDGSPSYNGATVVQAEDYDALRDLARDLAIYMRREGVPVPLWARIRLDELGDGQP